jgi:hypothetical protein
MSGMYLHMISGNLGWVFLLSLDWVVSKWILLGCGPVTVRLCDAIEIVIFEEMSLLPYY